MDITMSLGGVKMVTRTFTAIIHKEEDICVAKCPEVGTVSQGYTIEEAVANLKEATELYLEEFPVPEVAKPLILLLRRECMPKLRRVLRQEAIRALERLGFEKIRQRGGHVVLRKQTPEYVVGRVVSMYRELAIGTLRGVLQQTRVTPDEFMENL